MYGRPLTSELVSTNQLLCPEHDGQAPSGASLSFGASLGFGADVNGSVWRGACQCQGSLRLGVGRGQGRTMRP